MSYAEFDSIRSNFNLFARLVINIPFNPRAEPLRQQLLIDSNTLLDIQFSEMKNQKGEFYLKPWILWKHKINPESQCVRMVDKLWYAISPKGGTPEHVYASSFEPGEYE